MAPFEKISHVRLWTLNLAATAVASDPPKTVTTSTSFRRSPRHPRDPNCFPSGATGPSYNTYRVLRLVKAA